MGRARLAPMAALLPLVACGHPPAPLNVVVIVMDTARPDYLSVYGHPRPTSPFLERFAREGTLFRRAYSSAGWTMPAHASLFTGVAPEVHRATQQNLRLGPERPTLAELLAAAGYQTAGFSNNVWVGREYGLARGFQDFMERAEMRDARGAEGNRTVAALRSWLRTRRDPARPSFLFVNLIEPHMIYKPPVEFGAPFLGDPARLAAAVEAFFPDEQPNTWTLTRHYARERPLAEAEWRDLRALYEGELRLTDHLVEQLVAEVDAALPRERTLVFVLSDHGENLGDHDHLTHIFNLYDSNLRIALLARGPGFARGASEERLVQITDLHPTILGAAGLDAGADTSGLDLRAPLPERRLLRASDELPSVTIQLFPEEVRASGVLRRYERRLEAAIGPRWKLIRGSDGSDELYDLEHDPREERPVPRDAIDPLVVRELEDFLEATRGPEASAGEGAGLPEDPALLEELRALGYVK